MIFFVKYRSLGPEPINTEFIEEQQRETPLLTVSDLLESFKTEKLAFQSLSIDFTLHLARVVYPTAGFYFLFLEFESSLFVRTSLSPTPQCKVFNNI